MRTIAKFLVPIAFGAFSTVSWAQTPGPRTGNAAPDGVSAAASGRIERLEEQLVDLQGVVAAVETLAKSNAGGGSGYSASSGGASSEQIRQLSQQIADLTQRLERLEARLGSGGGSSGAPLSSSGGMQPRPQANYGTMPADGFDNKEPLPPLGSPQGTERQARQPISTPPSQFGAPPPGLPRSQSAGGDAGLSPRGSSAQTAALSPSSGGARTLYDQALAAFNKREYQAAQTYFGQFMEQYPSDPLAGSAQYWLGESAFVTGEYNTAAQNFLKAFTNYPASEKAPEALLKLAISLRRSGKNDEACDTFAELQRRFPQASPSIAQRSDAEKRRANCT